MQVRSFDKPFSLTDYTEELMLIPNTWGLVNEMGIFREESVTQHSITIEASEGTLGVLTDQVRGARNIANRDDTRKLLSFPIPHFNSDDYIAPEDLVGIRAYGDANAAETEAAVMARKLKRVRMNHAITVEAARCFAITNGAIYAPNGTVVGNYYTSFGVTRKEVDFVLGTTTTDVLAKGEEVVAHVQDNILSGEQVSSVAALCSPEFFSKLISQAGVKEAYKYYSSTQEPLRARLGTGLHRRFVHGGIEYIEYRGQYNGVRLIPAGDAYFMPVGTVDTFITYYSPANKLSLANTLGEPAYVFSYRDPMDEKIVIQSEHNAVHLIRRPQVIVRGFSSN